MKKVKMFSTAIMILAVVGGVFAFTPKHYSNVCLFTLNTAGTACPFKNLIKDVNIGLLTAQKSFHKPVDADCVAGGSVAKALCTATFTYDNE